MRWLVQTVLVIACRRSRQALETVRLGWPGLVAGQVWRLRRGGGA